MKEQEHLNFEDTVNQGSYYTPPEFVDLVYKFISKNVQDWEKYTILDTSCGYGNFLRENSIGADIDKKAIEVAKKHTKNCKFFNHDSLKDVGRNQYELNEKDKLIIVGNPPYNDTTSIVRKKMKTEICTPDSDLKHRDIGISFLRSYNKLNPDYICVLHPLSYLIKETNFKSLKDFKDNYKLIDGVIIGSFEFELTSKKSAFPIIIALYKKDENGMNYDYILNYTFKTKDNKKLQFKNYDRLGKYIKKYPNQKTMPLERTVALFWTMRDINALKRSQTFSKKESYNSIRVNKESLSLYCYADIFKDFAEHIPYYFGNFDIMINLEEFRKIEDLFVQKSLNKYPHLEHLKGNYSLSEKDEKEIEKYFKNLFGEHYED